jgi:hypothetical protein
MKWEQMKPLEPMFDCNDGRVEQYAVDIARYEMWDNPVRRAIRLGCTHMSKPDIAAFCIGNAWRTYVLRCKGRAEPTLVNATVRAAKFGFSSKRDVAAICIGNAWKTFKLRRLISCAKYFHGVYLTRYVIGHIQPDCNAQSKFRCKYFEKWLGDENPYKPSQMTGVCHLEPGDQIMKWLDEEHLPMVRMCANAIRAWSGEEVWYPETIETYTFPHDRAKYKERAAWAAEKGEDSARYYFGEFVKPKTCTTAAKRCLRRKLYDYLSRFYSGINLSSVMVTDGFRGGFVSESNALCNWDTFSNGCAIPKLSLFDLHVEIPEVLSASTAALDPENPPDQAVVKQLWERTQPLEPTFLGLKKFKETNDFNDKWAMQRPEFPSNVGNVSKDNDGFIVEGPVFVVGKRFVKLMYEPAPVFHDIYHNPSAVGNIPMNDFESWRQEIKTLFERAPRDQKVHRAAAQHTTTVPDDWVTKLQEKEAAMRIECAKHKHIEVYRNAAHLFFRCKYLGEYGHGFIELKYALEEYDSSEFRERIMRKLKQQRTDAAAKKVAYEKAKKERRKISDAKFREWAAGRVSNGKRKRSNEQHGKNKRSK